MSESCISCEKPRDEMPFFLLEENGKQVKVFLCHYCIEERLTSYVAHLFCSRSFSNFEDIINMDEVEDSALEINHLYKNMVVIKFLSISSIKPLQIVKKDTYIFYKITLFIEPVDTQLLFIGDLLLFFNH